MSCRVEQHPNIRLRLVRGFLSPKFHRVSHGSGQVGDLEVEVHRDPRLSRSGRPDWTHVVRRLLEADVRDTVGWCDGRILFIWARAHLPPKERRVELGQR